jgi:VanZ family protein
MSPRDRIRLIGSLSSPITMKRRFWWGLLILYAGAIFALSQTPVAVGEAPFPLYDKCFHAVEFALFFAVAWKATDRRPLPAFVLTAIYAGTDELHQLFVTTRTASALDLGADLLGATIALLVLLSGRRLWGFLSRRILGRNQPKVES